MVSSDPWIGKEVGNYRIVESINSGNFGSVYKGKHLHFEHDPVVAIKLPRATFHTEEERSQFIQEAQLQRQLGHPHILPILDAGFQNGIPYLVTMYAAGGSLRARLGKRNRQPLPLDEALVILTQIGQALHYAHQYQPPVVHRDLKPENILLDEQGKVLLADFGIAVLLSSIRTGIVGSGGTPPYMAPEQFEGLASPKSDQYALGCIAYELLTGRKVFSIPNATLEAWWYHHAKVEPMPPRQYNPHLPALIEQAILLAISKDRSKRHRDVVAFIQAMTGTKVQQKVGGVPDSPEAWVEAGIAHIQAGRYTEAVAACDQALQLNPAYAPAYTHKGAALTELDRFTEALAAYDWAIQLDPTYAPAYAYKAGALSDLKRHEEALVAYDWAIQLAPTDVVSYAGKGLALYYLERDEEALVAYDRALQLRPDYAGGYVDKANALVRLKRYEEALAAYNQALQLNPAYARAYAKKGDALLDLGRYEEALTAYNQALQLNPADGGSPIGKGFALSNLKRYEEALAACELALQLDPSNLLVYIKKGIVLDDLKWYEEALVAYFFLNDIATT